VRLYNKVISSERTCFSQVTGHGTSTWDTLGDATAPHASLSHTRRHETIQMPGQPGGGEVSNQTSELWQLCPQHVEYRNTSGGLLPSSCTKLPQPCFHRYEIGCPGRLSHSDTSLYISLVILHTKYTGWRDNGFSVYA
jgi:hypothetical protein